MRAKTMKSMAELMAELGFNRNSPLNTQKAFINHLIRAASQQDKFYERRHQPEKETVVDREAEIINEENSVQEDKNSSHQLAVQLAFNLDDAC